MNSIQARALAIAILILAASSNAWSQSGQTADMTPLVKRGSVLGFELPSEFPEGDVAVNLDGGSC
ncbi:hypothetical protein OKW38_007141 [Paraburkholderia sp. MM5496-R1]|uniref:hypothetical protein n=1 Tax=Paraburkholderia sp. MM5496-R1 TaxID=2991065 RepID=UPI003D1E02EE